jgi:hypothetical protein
LLWLPAGSRAQNPQAQEQATANAAPEPPASLAEVPEGQVVVRYENGELTIKANHAPLVDVLRAVCGQIGAELDAPTEAREPILIILGPAPARLVLGSLLDGSQFHYAMRQAADDPSALASVIVFPKTKDSKMLRPDAQDSVRQGQVGSTTSTSSGSGPDAKQVMRELLLEAKAEVANSGGVFLDLQGDENSGDADAGAQKVDAGTMLQKVEAQMKAIEDAAATGANSPQTGQLADPTAPAPVNPAGRPRHRARH